jgi:hypothetical protein
LSIVMPVLPLPKAIPWKYVWRSLVLILGVWFFVDLGARIAAELLWFQEVGYQRAFGLRLAVQGGIFTLVMAVSSSYLLGNLWLARRWQEEHPVINTASSTGVRSSRQGAKKPDVPPTLGLRGLLLLTISLSVVVGLLLVHQGQMAFSQWHPRPNLPNLLPPLPEVFTPTVLWQVGRQVFSQGGFTLLSLGLTIAVLVYPRVVLKVGAIGMSGLMGLTLARQWFRVLPAFYPTAFNDRDPVFGQDISLFVFALPVWELIEFWLVGVSLLGLVAVALSYLLVNNSLSEGRFPGFASIQQRHLYGLGGVVMLVIGLSHWLNRYELLYSPRGVTYGASYTDITAQLPAETGLSILSWTIALYLLRQAVFGSTQTLNLRPGLYGLGLYLFTVVTASSVLPTVVQSLIVQPNELVLEKPYIQRTIAATRKAFGLENIEARSFDPQSNLTQADLLANDLTIRNIRLWDQQPLLESNRQLQQIRLYYRFPDADIDRYSFVSESQASPPTLSKQQVLIAARELDFSAVPKQAQTWVNRALVYTHGYGFTMSPVNQVGDGGLPEYFVKDIGITEGTPLTTSSEAVRASIPIGEPRIYYGEITSTTVFTGTRIQELDYPQGEGNVYNTYDGQGGIAIGALWRRWLFAKYLNDWRVVLTPEFLPETKVLFRRNINRRVRAIAPFLRFDSDPYLVAADGNPGNASAATTNSKLFWIIDAYTTSDRYPYADVGSEGLNYIRNSVKAVIDAYNGTVRFYIADPHDPILATWATIFPEMFQPLSAMPQGLRRHIRYPVDFFKLQSERLMTYHMEDPQVFYNREDQWQLPNEVYGDKPRLVEPYYLITSLPTVPFEEFILLLPFTPKQRTNLIAWLAARSDGENYGKLLLYVFPKQRLVYGPEQIEARINQDPIISQQISLWNRQGSRVIQGNLLVIPIEQSLLYVEPLYLVATQNPLPILARVIVAYENRIAMAQTLEQALNAIFQPQATATPAIVRPIETPSPR